MSKKGFVYNSSPQIISLNPSWYYNWGTQNLPLIKNIPFTPMIWGNGNVKLKLSQIPSNATELLMYNEPDGNQPGAQSNVSIQTALQNWSTFKSTGLRIGSVASSQNPLSNAYTPNDGSASLTTSYFDSLWSQLTNAGMQPDFIALHWYAPPNANGFLNWIDNIYTKYKKPIWVTEMCVADWSGKSKFTTAQTQTFMDEVFSGMNSRDYVERYTWKTRPISDIYMGQGALFNDDGSLTALGEHYSQL